MSVFKREHWVMPLVFLAVALPVGLGLIALDVGGEWKLLIAIALGGVAANIAQARLRAGEAQERRS